MKLQALFAGFLGILGIALLFPISNASADSNIDACIADVKPIFERANYPILDWVSRAICEQDSSTRELVRGAKINPLPIISRAVNALNAADLVVVNTAVQNATLEHWSALLKNCKAGRVDFVDCSLQMERIRRILSTMNISSVDVFYKFLAVLRQ